MASFPQLNEEDFQRFTAALNDLLSKSEASTAMIVEKAGYLIHQNGDTGGFDATTVATLASNAFNATQFLTTLINENNFSGMYQQGENFSTLILNVDENCLLVIVFKAQLSVGMVKYYAGATIAELSSQLQIAQAREPGAGLDIIDLNPSDIGELFRRKRPAAADGATEAPAG
ncbi:MAG TPA: roadblock/LC7 domain-containing protein [Verrucomicrobiae bacterium]|nr:roadblock/LC7 domain-containing protein [Verrucomicrobiae bacterium]